MYSGHLSPAPQLCDTVSVQTAEVPGCGSLLSLCLGNPSTLQHGAHIHFAFPLVLLLGQAASSRSLSILAQGPSCSKPSLPVLRSTVGLCFPRSPLLTLKKRWIVGPKTDSVGSSAFPWQNRGSLKGMFCVEWQNHGSLKGTFCVEWPEGSEQFRSWLFTWMEVWLRVHRPFCLCSSFHV